MTKREVATLVFKVLGAYIVVIAVVGVFGSIFTFVGLGTMANDAPRWVLVVSWVGPYVAELVLGLWLWFSAAQLAEGVFANAETSESRIPGTTVQWLSVALALIGVYLVAVRLPELWGVIAYHLSLGRPSEVSDLVRANGPGPIVELSGRASTKLAAVIAGIVLILASWRIAPGILGLLSKDSDAEAGE